MSTEKRYGMGKRLDTLRLTGIIVTVAISAVFYFIYQYLLETIAPDLIGTPLLLIFVAVDVALIFLETVIFRRYRDKTYYRVTDDALEYTNGRAAKRYEWKDFTAAEYGRIRPGSVCPVVFTVSGRELVLNQYTERVYQLAEDILTRIEPYTAVSDTLKKQVGSMTDL